MAVINSISRTPLQKNIFYANISTIFIQKNFFMIKMSRIVSSAVIGNALEFYDLAVYGFFTSVISKNFFPQQDKLAGIASTFGIFLIGYLARPLGALFFGRVGDTLGRKSALIMSMWLMAFGSFSIGLLPNYYAIGVWAPILLVVLRMLQGFSFGGEYCGSIIFVLEHAPRTRRGFYGSITDAGQNLGYLLSALIIWLLNIGLSNEALVKWGWRLPFLLGSVLGIVGWFIRRNIGEAQLFRETYRVPDTFFDFYREYIKHMRHTLLIVVMSLFPSVLAYLIYVFIITYMSNILDYTLQQALIINILSIIILVLSEPLMGTLSDHIGRRPVMIFGLISCVLWSWPYFWLLQQNNFTLALLAQGIMTLFAAAYFAGVVVSMVEIVPIYLRFSVVAFAYAVALSIFGGMTPLVSTLLIKGTHSYVGLVLCLLMAALISAIAVYKLRETKPVPE